MKLSDKFWELVGVYILMPLFAIYLWILTFIEKFPYERKNRK